MEYRQLSVPEGLQGSRVDSGLAKLLGFSRSFATEIIEANGVTVDGRVVGKSERLQKDSWIEISWKPREEARIVPAIVPDLAVVYDDEDLIVVDKPVGVAAHPSVGWTGPTVLGSLAGAGYTLSTSGAAERAGIVHRLDAGTSGLMVVAKSENAFTWLKRAFHDREVDKIYHALVQGHPDPLAGTIDAPIGRHPKSDWKFAVTASGKPSITHYETLEAFPAASLVEVRLETGRTHQIRVHFSAQRHPCVGDAMYGADPTLSSRLGLSRQWLHALKLGFIHPVSRQYIMFESTYPADLQRALDTLHNE